MTKQQPLTLEEIDVCELAGKLWDVFLRLERMHPSEVEEFQFHIHALQNIVMSRAAQRSYPEIFPIYKENKKDQELMHHPV